MLNLAPRLADFYMPPAIIVRPVQPDDANPILEMHQRLSHDSIFSRYHSLRLPSRKEIDDICALGEENGRAVVAAVSGKTPNIVGIAYYVIIEQKIVEPAILVEDSYQGQGIGKRLAQCLRRQAIDQGIRYFNIHVLLSNQPLIQRLCCNEYFLNCSVDDYVCEMRFRL